MNETKKTTYFVATALLLAIVAFIFAPKRITPEAFLDQGETLFPEFTDPNVATTLEVISFDSTTGSASPFKVTFKGGRWTIPSHNDYPADGEDRLAKTAAGLIDIKKDDFRTDNVVDHEACGVIDPMDETGGLEGRGQRVTVKGSDDRILADLIIGNEVGGRTNMRFVRLPDQKRVYTVRMDLDISTNFADWIDTDLLEVAKHRISRVILKDYSINERTYSVNNRDVLRLDKSESVWKADKMRSSQKVDSTKMEELLTALDSLRIVGVRRKPAGLSANLKQGEGQTQMDRAALMSLQSKGYYKARDGRLLSNEGELQFETADGAKYTLRFGEVVFGSGLAVTAGAESDQSGTASGAAQNRYLFISVEYAAEWHPEPPRPADSSYLGKAEEDLTDDDKENKRKSDAYAQWDRDQKRARETVDQLNRRFADWYYVIPSDAFEKLHLTRADLVVAAE